VRFEVVLLEEPGFTGKLQFGYYDRTDAVPHEAPEYLAAHFKRLRANPLVKALEASGKTVCTTLVNGSSMVPTCVLGSARVQLVEEDKKWTNAKAPKPTGVEPMFVSGYWDVPVSTLKAGATPEIKLALAEVKVTAFLETRPGATAEWQDRKVIFKNGHQEALTVHFVMDGKSWAPPTAVRSVCEGYAYSPSCK
jgi:hypothetical protein